MNIIKLRVDMELGKLPGINKGIRVVLTDRWGQNHICHLDEQNQWRDEIFYKNYPMIKEIT